MAHHDLYHERCLYSYLGIRKLLKGHQDTSGCSLPSLSPVLIFLPSGRGKEGASIEWFGATCVSNTTIRYKRQESGIRVSGSIMASSETRTAKNCDLPLHTDPHGQQTALFCFMPHFALLPTPLLCVLLGAHPKSSLRKRLKNKYIKL